jgi:hypothetical protein
VKSRALAGGLVVFFAACSMPWVGLWNPNGIADTGLYGLYGTKLVHGLIPYRDYFMEFPPGAIPALALPALPGSHYVVWFKIFEFLCGAGCIACVVALVARRRYAAVAVAAIAPAVLGAISLNSFDYWPAFLTVAAVLALVSGRRTTAFVLLGFATSAKLFPVGLLALALLFVGRREWRRSLAAYVVAVLVVFLPFLALGPGGLRYSLETQLRRGLQLESLGASLLVTLHHLGLYHVHYSPHLAYAQLAGSLASAVAALSTVVMIAAVAFVAWRYWRGGEFVVAAAATVTGIVAFAKVLSPQYLLWLVPLVAACAVCTLRAPLLLLVALGLTQIWVPDRFAELQSLRWVTWVLLVRNLVLVLLFFELATATRAPQRAPALADPG